MIDPRSWNLILFISTASGIGGFMGAVIGQGNPAWPGVYAALGAIWAVFAYAQIER